MIPVKTSIKPKKKPPVYLVRAVNAEWEVNNGSIKFEASSINEAFKAIFEWETETAAKLRAAKRTPSRAASMEITDDIPKVDLPKKVSAKKPIKKPAVKTPKKKRK